MSKNKTNLTETFTKKTTELKNKLEKLEKKASNTLIDVMNGLEDTVDRTRKVIGLGKTPQEKLEKHNERFHECLKKSDFIGAILESLRCMKYAGLSFIQLIKDSVKSNEIKR